MTAAVAEPGVREVDWRAYIADVEAQWPGLLGTPSGRRILTRNDPLLFALLYFRHHLKDADGQITLSEFHLTICEQTKQWIRQDAEPEKAATPTSAPATPVRARGSS